jgi:hypothetical protein
MAKSQEVVEGVQNNSTIQREKMQMAGVINWYSAAPHAKGFIAPLNSPSLAQLFFSSPPRIAHRIRFLFVSSPPFLHFTIRSRSFQPPKAPLHSAFFPVEDVPPRSLLLGPLSITEYFSKELSMLRVRRLNRPVLTPYSANPNFRISSFVISFGKGPLPTAVGKHFTRSNTLSISFQLRPISSANAVVVQLSDVV